MRALPYVGVLLLFALTAGGVVFVADAALDLDRGLLETTRTPVPGSRVLYLEQRKYNVFFEADELHGAHPEVPVRVQAIDSDHAVELGGYSGSFTISGSRDSSAFATVHIPEAGRYRVVVRGPVPGDYSDPAVVLGEPIRGRVGRIVAGILVGAVAFMAAVALLIVALTGRSRRRARGAQPDS